MSENQRFCRLDARTAIVTDITCNACESRVDDGATAPAFRTSEQTVDCIHRGGVKFHVVCETCGDKGKAVPVHACKLHQQCTVARWTQRPTGIKNCLTCKDRPEP